ncbi:sulfate adenylyltransferase subunit 1, partial [uncultured Sphingomonas sp.]|uniref:sulfate adenylyltransferase subunit 1 n=1 Tax=uncultured Sphingomonas sp. TaxID=158754 RepID=UPI0035CB3CEC
MPSSEQPLSPTLSPEAEREAPDLDAFLLAHEGKSLLRFITCGSVDDGKSTLIGRLLHDTRAVFDDQMAALKAGSARMGTQGAGIDFALLVDGLQAEREQGITIDVAYRYFATARRKFMVADTAGHEQYTRNMVTGASTADLAIILVDARKGVLTQTRRHGYLVNLLGVRRVVLAVNKMDLVGWDRARFEAIAADYAVFAESIEAEAAVAIPVSGFLGDNVVAVSADMPWYEGPTLLGHLETVSVDAGAARPFRMPVQWVNRPDPDFRGFAGTVASGTVKPGDAVRVLPSGRTTSIARVVTFDGDLDEAEAGRAVVLTLADEVDCARGDVIAAAADPPPVADQFEATIVWMADAPMLPGRGYWLKLATQTVTAQVAQP